MKKVEITAKGTNYAAASVGLLSELNEHVFSLAPGINIPGKVFVGETIGSTGTEVSFTVVPAGMGGDFLHIHNTNEETYIVLKGNGVFQVDGELCDIAEGSVIRVSPSGKRAFRNSGTVDLVVLCIQSKVNTLQDLGIADGVILEEPVKW